MKEELVCLLMRPEFATKQDEFIQLLSLLSLEGGEVFNFFLPNTNVKR